MQRARLADIAAQAGVSEATVSRVLNGRSGVADSTAEGVLTALDVLGYERPVRLRKRKSGLVGLIVPELDNPIFPAFAQVIETACSQRGYTPILCTQSPGGSDEGGYVDMLLDHGVAGIIFVCGEHADTTADASRYRRLVERGLPIVLVNGYAEAVDAHFVSCDDAVAVALAVDHLVSLGHRRIGFACGPDRFMPAVRKLAAFTSCIGRLPQVEGFVEISLFSVEGGHAATSRLLDRQVTGVVCGSDPMALGAVRAVRQRGLSVPADVSVVGYDDSPLIAFTDPPLTTVRQPVHAMASAAVRSLVDQIRGLDSPRDEYLFRPELVVRESTGASGTGGAAVND